MAERMLLPGEIVSLTARAADLLLESDSGDAALLYLWLLRRGGELDVRAAGRALRWDTRRTEETFETLARLDLADRACRAPEAPLPEPDEPPEYTAADLTREMEDKASPFPALVAEAQRRMGKILSAADLKMLYTIYDYLAMPPEVILLLVNWCAEEAERKYGPGRPPRMSQIRREAFVWHRRGADTPEAAEAYLKKAARLRSREGQLLRLLDIRDRVPVDAERRYLDAWAEMGFEDEAIRLAYERTVLKKQSLNWPYMNSILRSWHQKGLHTAEAVRRAESARPGPAGMAPAPMPAAPGEADRRAREDMERLRALMRREKGEG